MSYAKILGAPTPQNKPLDERQVKNSAGGYVYTLDRYARLERFLILGSDTGTYYASALDLTKQNVGVVSECWLDNPFATAGIIQSISVEGRAPRNDAAILAIAIGAVHPTVVARQLALAAMPRVCRTGTHLFMFIEFARALGKGWGRAMKRAVARWYAEKPAEDLAYQAVKYRQRNGYTHERVMRTVHPKTTGTERDNLSPHDALYAWMAGREIGDNLRAYLPPIIGAHEDVMKMTGPTEEMLATTLEHRLPWEALPTWANSDPDVQAALLPTMGLTALLRNLGNLTRIGVITPLSENEAIVVRRLTDEKALKKARIHPFALMVASKVYGSGQGFKGKGTWTPSQAVRFALEKAFHLAFVNVVPTGKRIMLALDVSGSMGQEIMGSPFTARDASAALALITAKTEDRVYSVGFSTGLIDLPILGGDSLDVVTRRISGLPFQATDCALPMQHAISRGLQVDAFVVITDNETWFGHEHPVSALKRYRTASGIPAKLAVIGVTPTPFTIADPNDAGMMDFVGFDASGPAILADFIRK